MADRIETKGFREFRRALKQADENFPRELRQANKDAADIVVPTARANAPKGPHQGGGRITTIEASIRAGATQRSGYIAAGGARTPHAGPREFGGTLRRHASPKKTQVPAEHYVEHAVNADIERVDQAYGHMLDHLYAKAFPD